ncbi:MAG: hypothetical protein J6I46_10395 [Ruminococcus sp.]|nr:hypothetical protein [Ruminococcus sp.]
MKKHFAAAAVMAAMMLAACGKSSSPDLPDDYKSYLDYTFDGNYSVGALEENTDENGYITKSWDVSYKDKDGEEHSDKLKLTYLETYDSDFLKSECDWAVMNFVMTQENKRLEEELMELIKAQFTDLKPVENNGDIYYAGDGYDLDFAITRLESIFWEDTSVFGEILDPSSGEKYTACDLKTCASGKTMTLRIIIDIADINKTAEVQSKLDAFTEAYKSYTGEPQNYCFTLYGPTDTETPSHYVCSILGEEADPAEFEAGNIYAKLGGSYEDRAPEM